MEKIYVFNVMIFVLTQNHAPKTMHLRRIYTKYEAFYNSVFFFLTYTTHVQSTDFSVV
jgi:hypothetical protein